MKQTLNNILFFLLYPSTSSELCFSQDTTSQFFEGYDITIAGNYQANSLGRFFAGDHWINLWITSIKVPLLDLDNFAGRLTPFEKGGSLQTKSLKFFGVLATIEEDPGDDDDTSLNFAGAFKIVDSFKMYDKIFTSGGDECL